MDLLVYFSTFPYWSKQKKTTTTNGSTITKKKERTFQITRLPKVDRSACCFSFIRCGNYTHTKLLAKYLKCQHPPYQDPTFDKFLVTHLFCEPSFTGTFRYSKLLFPCKKKKQKQINKRSVCWLFAI